MLQAIRETITGWIAYGVIFLISIPFALWGVNSYLGGGEVAPAATVDGEEVTVRELDQAYANYRQRLAQLFGGTIPESFGSEAILREQVLDQLIEEYALRQYASRQRYRIGDEELSRIIRGMDVFHSDGKFDTSIYQAQLRSLGYSPLGFEQELRRNQAVEQIQAGIRGTAFLPPVIEKKYISLDNQTRSIRTLSLAGDASTVQPSEADIQKYYEDNASRFRTPEQLKIDYIELSLESVKAGIEVAEADVRARYEDSRDAYTTPEVREASHILIKSASDAGNQAALEQIKQIRARIVNGEDFAALAREFSQDPGSAADGGNLGEIERGVMVQTFEAALFAMEVDQLSEPVKTGFGWHLIKLHAISGGDTQSFESVKADLEDEIKTTLAESQVFDLVENLANIAYEQSDSLEPAAEQLDLNLQTSDWFDRFSGSGIAAEARIRQQAFSAEVLQQGLNSEAIELGTDRVVFLRINDRKGPAAQPLEEVSQRIESEIVQQQLRDKNREIGSAALTQLRDGKSLDDLAREWSTTIVDQGFITRDQAGIDANITQRSFSMPKPEQGKVFEGLVLDNGEYVVIELSAVLSNDEQADADAGSGLLQAQSDAEYQAILKLLTSRADIVKTPADEL